jgi:hypothetical protein
MPRRVSLWPFEARMMSPRASGEGQRAELSEWRRVYVQFMKKARHKEGAPRQCVARLAILWEQGYAPGGS